MGWGFMPRRSVGRSVGLQSGPMLGRGRKCRYRKCWAPAPLLCFSLHLGAAGAQAPQVVRVRAMIESVDGSMLTAKARDGTEMKIKVADNAPVNEGD